MTSAARIREQLARIRALAATPERQLLAAEPSRSAWSPAEHLDHILKVAGAIVGRLGQDDPPALGRGISLLGRLVLVAGWIPRGRAKSPARLVGTQATGAALADAAARVERALEAVTQQSLARGAPVVPHPVFGGLTAAQAMRFIAVHNAHHLRIVDEILRSSSVKNTAAGTSRPSR